MRIEDHGGERPRTQRCIEGPEEHVGAEGLANMLHTPSPAFMASEAASELYCDEVLTGEGFPVRLDRYGSVSGLIRFDSATGPQLVHISELLRPKGAPHGW